MKKLIALLLAGCMMATMVVGCGSKEEAAEAPAVTEEVAEAVESDLAYVKEKGTLVVGITDFAPMDYKNEDGEWIGFDADMEKFLPENLVQMLNLLKSTGITRFWNLMQNQLTAYGMV